MQHACSHIETYCSDALKCLGEALQSKFPRMDFRYEDSAGLWVSDDPAQVARLRNMFDFGLTNYLESWRTFLGLKDLIVLGHDCEEWFAFTLD